MRENRVSMWNLFIGIILASAGAYAAFQPTEDILTLSFYLGVVFTLSGILKLISSIASKYSTGLCSMSLLDLFIGAIFIGNVGTAIANVPLIFAFWTMFTGITRISMAPELYNQNKSYWSWELFVGIIGIVLAFIILINPVLGAFSTIIVMSATLILYGALDIGEFFVLRKNSVLKS